MPSTLKIDKIESRTPNVGLTIDWIGGGLKGPNNIPILTEDGKIVGDLLLLAQAANTPNTTTAALDFIREATPGQGIRFLDTVYGLSSANVVAIDLISTNGTFSTITTDTLTANTISVTGDLVVAGNTITLDTQTLLVEDNIVVFGSNNVADITDLGFAVKYSDGSDKYAGIFRDATDKKFYVFQDYNLEPPTATLTGFNVNSMRGTLVGDFEAVTSVTTSLVTTDSDLDITAPDGNITLTADLDITIDASSGGNIFLRGQGGAIFAKGHVLPETSGWNIGSSSKPWNTLYVNDIQSTGTTTLQTLVATNSTLENTTANNVTITTLFSNESTLENTTANNATITSLNSTSATIQTLEATSINAVSYSNVDYNNLINKPDAQLQAIADDAFVNSIIFG